MWRCGVEFWWDTTPLNDDFKINMNQYNNLYGSAKGGMAADNMLDAYSIILHELGHALGFMGATGTGTWVGNTYSWNVYTSFADNLSGSKFTYDFLADKDAQVPMLGPFHLKGRRIRTTA